MKVEELDLSQTYMAKYYFNSKKITWQPCIVLSKEIKPNQNGFDCIEVKFFNGQTKMVYAKDGVCADSLGNKSLKPLPKNWMENEVAKIDKEIEELNIKRLELLALKKSEE